MTVNGGQGHVTITDFEIDDVITFCGCGATQKEQRGDDAWIVKGLDVKAVILGVSCLLYTSPSPRDGLLSRMPSSA